MQAVAKRVWEYKHELNDDLAARIVNGIGKTFFSK
jgi:hypothetical protein